MAASFGGGSPLVNGFGVPSSRFRAHKCNFKSRCAVKTYTKTGLSVLYAFLYNSGKPNQRSQRPTAPPGAHSFYRSSPQPPPSAAPPSAFSKSVCFPSIYLWFFCQRSTFCTNRAHKLCVSSQGLFSFCIPSQFSGISKLYKLCSCLIIHFSFFAMFHCLLYSQNFFSVSWRIMNKALI